MTTITAHKSRVLSQLEGVALSAVLQGFPLCAAVTMLLKTQGQMDALSHQPAAVMFAVTASILYALMVRFFGARFPHGLRGVYQPVFYDAGLSMSDKFLGWSRRATAREVITNIAMLVMVASLAMRPL